MPVMIFYATWCANGLRVGVFKSHAPMGEAIEERRFIVCSTIGSETFVAHVVGHNENDVRLLLGRTEAGHEKNKCEQYCFELHIYS